MRPGRQLALLAMKMYMAMLLRRFDIEAVTTPDGGPAQERLKFTLRPDGRRRMLRERRAPGVSA